MIYAQTISKETKQMRLQNITMWSNVQHSKLILTVFALHICTVFGIMKKQIPCWKKTVKDWTKNLQLFSSPRAAHDWQIDTLCVLTSRHTLCTDKSTHFVYWQVDTLCVCYESLRKKQTKSRKTKAKEEESSSNSNTDQGPLPMNQARQWKGMTDSEDWDNEVGAPVNQLQWNLN